MILKTNRLLLRPWDISDADDLFEYAKDPDIGTPAGWQPHKTREESADIIRTVLSLPETYKAIGSIGLRLNGNTDMTDRDDECELGYWIGKPFWGRGLVPEAANEIIRHGFEELGMRAIWCGYYEGNERSHRVQEKCGFVYQHKTEGLYVKMFDEYRTGHCSLLTKERWENHDPA